MGLLTDPGVEGGWLGNILLKHHKLLAALLYLLGTAWFLALAHNSMNHGTYFSENALLPGLVQGEFMGESRANRYLQELSKESERYPSSMPHAWLLAKLTQIGLDTYTHNFTLHYPMAVNKSFTGRNVYGVLRAVRGASTESIVVSAPYRAPHSVHPTNTPAIALMLAMAHFFADQVYWAKDIIFLMTEHEQLGVEAWLQAYHGVTAGAKGVLDYGTLPARAGPIQAAVNLEISSSPVSHVDIRYEGLNGQLPNLDLVNLLHRLCHRENVRHTIKNRVDHPRPESFDGWVYQLGTLAATVATQASGVPSGNHGLFHRYGIAAVTVSGERGDQRWSAGRSASLLQLGRVLEGTCRSLNNLLERFHQSFFFYLMPATNRYISIGVYMPAFGMVGSSLLLVALALWCSSSILLQQQRTAAEEDTAHSTPAGPHSTPAGAHSTPAGASSTPAGASSTPAGASSTPAGAHSTPAGASSTPAGASSTPAGASSSQCGGSAEPQCGGSAEPQCGGSAEPQYSLVSCGGVLVLVHCLCLLVSWCPRTLAVFGGVVGLRPEDSVIIGLVAFALTLLRLPRAILSRTDEAPASWEVVKCVAVLELAVLVFAGAVHNFSLALLVTLLYTPLALITAPSRSRLYRYWKGLLLLAAHPLTLLVAFVSLDTALSFPEEAVWEVVVRCGVACKHALMYSVVDGLVYGNWVFPVACTCLLPVWMLLWHVLHSEHHSSQLAVAHNAANKIKKT